MKSNKFWKKFEKIKLQKYTFFCSSWQFTEKPSAPVGPLVISDVTEDFCELEWKAPESDGGLPITAYCVEMREVRRSAWTKCAEIKPTHARCHVSGMLTDNEYMFRVSAINEEGQGPCLNSVDSAKPKKPIGKFMKFFVVSTLSFYMMVLHIRIRFCFVEWK